jgi:uncharacterized protein
VADKIRAVLDTNVFVSAVIHIAGVPGQILKYLSAKKFVLITSPPINDEVIRVLNRPHIRKRYNIEDSFDEIAFILYGLAEVVSTLPVIQVSSDSDDDKFIQAAVGGDAHYLVSGDEKGLLVLKRYKGVRIVTPREFLNVLQ